MHRFLRLLVPAILLTLSSSAFAGASAGSIAIYAGTEKITSIGGGNSNSGNGSSTGKRRQPVYIAVDTATGDVQRVSYNTRTKKYFVESAVRYYKVTPRTDGRRPKDYIRLMLASHAEPQTGGFTDTSTYYEGRMVESVISSAGLPVPFPRVMKWNFAFQYSGFEVAPPAVTTYPQIDSGTALLSLNRVLTRAAAGKPMEDAINIIIGALAQRRYTADVQ